MAKFDKAFTKVIKAEGGYVNDPNDKGGETYLGISRKAHPNSKMWEYIDEIKKQMPTANTNAKLTVILKKDIRIDNIVKEIYKTQYWNVLKCDDIISQKVAEQLFDMGVNAGPSRAVQLMCNVVSCVLTNKATDNFIKAVNGYARKTNKYLS